MSVISHVFLSFAVILIIKITSNEEAGGIKGILSSLSNFNYCMHVNGLKGRWRRRRIEEGA